MIEIETKVGVLYLESEDDREETDRLKLYDSEHRYFDYWSLDNLVESETITDLIASITEGLSKIETVDELIDMHGIDVELVSARWEDFIPYICGDEAYFAYDGESLIPAGVGYTEEYLLENEFVNKVGNAYILIAE